MSHVISFFKQPKFKMLLLWLWAVAGSAAIFWLAAWRVWRGQPKIWGGPLWLALGTFLLGLLVALIFGQNKAHRLLRVPFGLIILPYVYFYFLFPFLFCSVMFALGRSFASFSFLACILPENPTTLFIIGLSLLIVLIQIIVYRLMQKKLFPKRFPTFFSFQVWLFWFFLAISLVLFSSWFLSLTLLNISFFNNLWPISLSAGLFLAVLFVISFLLIWLCWRQPLKKLIRSRYEFPLNMCLGALLTGLLLLLILKATHGFDEKPDPGMFAINDLPVASFANTNGFYQLWGLVEPEGIDVQGEAFIAPLREIFKPGVASKKFGKQFDYETEHQKAKAANQIINKIKFPNSLDRDWLTELKPQAAAVDAARQGCTVLLKRYRTLLVTREFADFTYPAYDAPTPNLLFFLRAARLYTALSAAKALSGNWQEAVSDLIVQLDFGKRALPRSRSLILNLVTKAVMNLSLQGLVSIMNQPTCPNSVYKQVLASLPPLKQDEYGMQVAFVFEGLLFFQMFDDPRFMASDEMEGLKQIPPLFRSLFYQKNSSKNYMQRTYAKLVAYESQEPYLWKINPEQELKDYAEKITKANFLLLKNPVGKIIFAIAAPNLAAAMFKSYRLRMRYEMTKILAELHLQYTPKKSIPSLLPELESYKAIDPGSGQPYRWSEARKVLYSIGVDKKDNGGSEEQNSWDTDVAVPVVLKK